MSHKHSLLIYSDDGSQCLLVKEFRKKLFFSVYILCAAVCVLTAANLLVHRIILNYEIAKLNTEQKWLLHKYSTSREQINELSGQMLELNKIKRIIEQINPFLTENDKDLWIKTIMGNRDYLRERLNDNSLAKLKSSISPYALGPAVSLVLSVAAFESDFHLNASSNKGAYGPMQLLRATAENLGVKNHKNPEENIKGGIAYLAELLEQYYSYEDQIELALASYNAGGTRVQELWIPTWGTRWNNINKGLHNCISDFSETRDYVKSVVSLTGLFVSGDWNYKNRIFWSDYKRSILTDQPILLASLRQ